MIALGVAGLQVYLRSSRARWAEKEALPEVVRLVDRSRYLSAVALLREAEPYVPNSPELIRLKANLPTGTVRISTMPEGADVYIRDYADTEPGDPEWRLLGRSPVQTDMVPQSYYPRGTYRVRAVKQGFETVEWAVVLGHIFQDVLTIDLHATDTTPAGMVWVPGITALGTSQTSPANAPEKTSAFWLDRNEVTNREFKEFVDKGGYEKREYWKEPFVKEGKALTWEQAMAEFRDPTGRRGPAAWQLGSYKEGEADFPVGGVSWYEAAAYAAFAGKSLPTVYHWYRAAAIGPLSDILNFSNFAGRGPARTEMYRGLGRFGNYDMAGNVQEWVSNAAGQLRYTLGGAWDTPKYQFGLGLPDARDPFERRPTFGFRCAKYTSPIPNALLGPVAFVADRDRRRDKPVDDEAYKVFLSLHAYDKTELKSTVDSVEDASPYWRVEHVSFDAAYGNKRDRVIAHLYLPRNSTPPHQVVAFMGGSDTFNRPRYEDSDVQGNFGFIIRSGRALIVPAYSGTLERGPGDFYHRRGEPQRWQDMNLMWSKDLGRSIDYLETRPDIDTHKLAFFGISLGAGAAPRLVAVEPRFKAAVLLSGGSFEKVLPAVDTWNFAPRFKTPVLMLNGADDFTFPLETSQIPLFRQLGTPEKDKKHVVFDGGHASPVTRLDMVKEALDWLDRYIGPVNVLP